MLDGAKCKQRLRRRNQLIFFSSTFLFFFFAFQIFSFASLKQFQWMQMRGEVMWTKQLQRAIAQPPLVNRSFWKRNATFVWYRWFFWCAKVVRAETSVCAVYWMESYVLEVVWRRADPCPAKMLLLLFVPHFGCCCMRTVRICILFKRSGMCCTFEWNYPARESECMHGVDLTINTT